MLDKHRFMAFCCLKTLSKFWWEVFFPARRWYFNHSKNIIRKFRTHYKVCFKFKNRKKDMKWTDILESFYMRTIRNLLTLFICSISFVLLLYSYAYSQAHSYNRNTGYGAIWGLIICAWICGKRRKNPIGGWLLYYYIQLYGGTVLLLFLSVASFENYIPANWDDKSLYLFYLISTIPQEIANIAELIFASLLLKQRFRNSSKVNWLRAVFVFSIVFSIIGLAIDYTYWKESVPSDILGLAWPSIWLLYFTYSKRVKCVLIDNYWESYEKMMKQSSKYNENEKIEKDDYNNVDMIDYNLPDKSRVTINKFKIFSSYKKLSKGLFRLIVVFSFIISTAIPAHSAKV